MQISFRYSHIRIDEFATLNGSTDQRRLDFQTSGEIQTGFSYEAKSILITVHSNVELDDQLLMTIKVSSQFEIEPDCWERLKKDGFVVIPMDFLRHIGGLAVSSTRGIVFAKTEGTDLNSYILPLIQMDQVILSDMKIPIVE